MTTLKTHALIAIFAGLLLRESPASAHRIFSSPTIVQNYPVDNQLPMNGAELSYMAISELINSAEERIDVSPFYINNKAGSKLNEYIIQPLLQQGRNGIKVRILADKMMASEYPKSLAALKNQENVELVLTDKYDKMNGVNHAKMMIVDGKRFYLGSHNFDWITFELNHELGVVYDDPALAAQMQVVYDSDWSGKELKAPRVKSKGPYSIATSPKYPGIKQEEPELLGLMANAKETIRMQAMTIEYYDPYMKEDWVVFKDAILDAAKRGVKVKMMMSNWEFTKWSMEKNNEFFQSLLKSEYGKNIEIRYTSFPAHNPCVPYSEVNHAKYMVIDDNKLWIGTGNLSKGYFYNSRDYSFFAHGSKELGSQLKDIFDTMWDSKYATEYVDAVTVPVDNKCAS